MSDPFTGAIQAALVLVRGQLDRKPRGTGFFVGARLIATCRHVVDGVGELEVCFDGRVVPATLLNLSLSRVADLALLGLDADAPAAPGLARLGFTANLYDKVRARGFPVRDGAPHEEQVTGTIEDTDFQHSREPWKSGARLLQFKESQIEQGFSGSPLISEEWRRVVGVVTTARGANRAWGGVAVPAKLLLEDDRVRAAQHAVEWDATVWADPAGAETPFLEYYLDQRRPFFGRGAVLASLDDWLERGPQRAVLIVPSGKGKSSVIARWYERLRHREEVLAGRTRVQLVPISLQRELSRREEVLISLERAVARLCGTSLSGRDENNSFDRRRAIRDGLGLDAPTGERRLLIVDGLDETMGWEVDAALFPKRLGKGVHILLAARAMADLDEEHWRERLGWAAPTHVQSFILQPLGLDDMREAVSTWWMVKTRVEDYARRLLELTRGDALLVGLYLREHSADTLPPHEQLGSVSGLEGFFKAWWDQQQAQWAAGEGSSLLIAVHKTLSVLASAFGPMSRRTLLRCLQETSSFTGAELDEALRRLARLIEGSKNGYSVSHPELARWWWNRLRADGETRAIDAAFVALARRMLDGQLVAEPDVEGYLLRATPMHLQRMGEADLSDVAMLAGKGWHERHQKLDRWPELYEVSLQSADASCRARDQAALAAGRQCPALGVRVELALRRMSVVRLKRRITGRTAAAFARYGLWTPHQALEHVLASYQADFPRIAALGQIAALLGPREINVAMESLGLEREYGFNWDDSLGAWEVACAATVSGAIDFGWIRAWAIALPGVGKVAALFGHASGCSGEERVQALTQAMNALPAAGSAIFRTAVALASRVGSMFRLEELAAVSRRALSPYMLAEALGYNIDEPECAATALRIAWPWLDASEIAARVEQLRVVDLKSAVEEHPSWDWTLALGAIWDVCSVDQAARLFEPLEAALTSHLWRSASNLYTTAVRLASRLPGRNFKYSKSQSLWIAFGGSHSSPQVRAQFRAEASLEAWRAPLSELILQMDGYQRIDALDAVADLLPPPLLDHHLESSARISMGPRDMVLRPIYAAMANRSAADARQVQQRADRFDTGFEYQLSTSYLEALSVPARRSDLRKTGWTVLQSLPCGDALRTQVLSVLAPALSPWSLADCDQWMAKNEQRELGLSFLLPLIEPAELDDLGTASKLKIYPIFADRQSILGTLRGMYKRRSLDAVLDWTNAMMEAAEEKDERWLSLLVEALASDAAPSLVERALSVRSADIRAQCCASLLGQRLDPGEREKLWGCLEPVLRERDQYSFGQEIAEILRRLRGEDLAHALKIAAPDTQVLLRKKSADNDLWVDEACWLVPWLSAEVIDQELWSDGELAGTSGEARSLLQAALLPRFLELGLTDRVGKLVYDDAGWRRHVAIVRHLREPEVAGQIARSIAGSARGMESVFAMVRELRRLGDAVSRGVKYAIFEGFAQAADTEADLFLVLLAVMGEMEVLGGQEVVERGLRVLRDG